MAKRTIRRRRRTVRNRIVPVWGWFLIIIMFIPIFFTNNNTKVEGYNVNSSTREIKPIKYKNTTNLRKGRTLAYWVWKGESPRRKYNDYNRGSDRCRKSNRRNVNLVNMKISTLKYHQSLPRCTSNYIFAAGWQQTIPNTLKICQRSMKFSNNAKYNKYLQDKIFVECLTKSKRPTIYSYVTSGRGLKIAARAVAREWASIGSPIHCNIKRYKKLKNGKLKVVGVRPWSKNGGCYNSGYGINHHSVHPSEILKSLQQARHNYTVLRKRGVNNMKAYAYSIGVEKY